jgi:hypothetical protein
MAVQRHLDSLSFFLDMFFMHSNFGSNIYICQQIWLDMKMTRAMMCQNLFKLYFKSFFWSIQFWIGAQTCWIWIPNPENQIQTIQISIQNSELQSKLSKFQFRILNWNPNYPNFNSEFWIEIQTIQISIQNKFWIEIQTIQNLIEQYWFNFKYFFKTKIWKT